MEEGKSFRGRKWHGSQHQTEFFDDMVTERERDKQMGCGEKMKMGITVNSKIP